ncbi:MAG: glycosyltransferase family 39 protein, partial [Clostridia bacterium]|nr:glycosyltransferase family 39 protein [Clostridia bacterium]
MKKIKLYGIVAFALIIVLALGYFLFFRTAPADAASYENLLKNADFSQVDAEGNPSNWYLDAYAGLSGAEFSVVEENGQNAARIVNLQPKDARFAQEVHVSPNTLYRLHGYIKADAQDGWGANLSIEGGYYYSAWVHDSQGEWQEVALYGRTGENQKYITVFARLGGYSGEATGEALFRDLSLSRVDSVPDGYTALTWAPAFGGSGSEDETEGKESTASLPLILSSCAYVLLFGFLCRFLRRPRTVEEKKSPLRDLGMVSGVLLLALIVRLLIAAKVPGYNVDIGCFRAWANGMAASGPAGFYPPDDPFSYCDYPPGYLWILWALGGIGKLLGTGVTEFMIKLPPIAADIALCAVLYHFVKKELGFPAALALTILYAFSPLILATGAAWGQADALMTLLLLLVVIFAVKGCWKAALPCYMAAVLCKPQALMFGPLGLIAFILHLVEHWQEAEKRRAVLKDAGLGLVFTVITAFAIALPFSIHQKTDWLITLYGQTMGRYAYATVNSCNLYFLLGKNWVGAGSNIGLLIPLLALCLTVLPMACAWLCRREKALFADEKDRLLALILGGISLVAALTLILLSLLGSLTYSTLGTVMIVLCVAVIAVMYVHAHDIRNLPMFGAALLLALFNVGSMMHERYLFPAVALLLLGYALKKDARILWLAVGVAVAGFLNVGCALDRNIRIGGAAGHLNAPAVSIVSDTAGLEYLSSVLNCVVCFASLWLCAAEARGEVLKFSAETEIDPPLPQAAVSRKMTGRDWAILSVITVSYSVLAFTNLGSMKGPQTAYVSASPTEQIVLDLGESRNFQMLFYGGIHYSQSDFTVEISEDGQRYPQSYTGGMPIGDCFKWKYLSYTPNGSNPVDLSGRYVRVTADNYNLTLFEVLFRDAETGESIPASVIEDQGNKTAAYLADEPDSMEGEYPSWYNSTYFDEIYHARTGFELLHHLSPYEWTHPPLGKVMMSWAISIFGMTPFGWRFAGTLAGVLMLPGMYLLGRLLIRRKWGGPAAALLMVFDLMHFTQTRIATIDSFVVLWIIWMVYFMLCWFFLDFFRTPFWKTLIPLALSGICMGLGIASKWTACYAGVVLAILFFFGIFRRVRLVRAARKIPDKEKTEDDKKTASGGKYLILTVASCLILFVLIPLIIYYCSYIPFFAYDGAGVTVDKVIRQAVGTYFIDGNITVYCMLGYHSQPGLGMDHAFYSPWYEWPIIAKPMYYSSNGFEPAGYQMSIMAMGNPAVWWTGLLGILLLAGVFVKRHMRRDASLSLYAQKSDPRIAIVLLCYFVQLLPWILVPRGTYIYHYFPCVPFLILAIVLCLDLLADCGTDGQEAESASLTALWRKSGAERSALILL